MGILKCPPNSLSKAIRINKIYDYFEQWLRSESMQSLVNLTGGDYPVNQDFIPLFEYLYSYSRKWDFRSNSGNSQERWSIQDGDEYALKSDKIISLAIELGLGESNDAVLSPTYIVPIGGARMSNYTRCERAYQLFQNSSDSLKGIIALSGLRELNEIEMPFVETYAGNAKTEFDAMSSAFEAVFSLGEIHSDVYHVNDNPNLSWRNIVYKSQNQVIFASLAAPSLDPVRRANSYDTFEYLLKNISLEKEDVLAIVTSSIYIPFQLIRFLPIALEREINVEFVGGASGAFVNASNYCQEIKATLDAMKFFMAQYPLDNL
ncbi:TPA: hypothetical protein ACGOZ1_002250 [Streptococcus suis]